MDVPAPTVAGGAPAQHPISDAVKRRRMRSQMVREHIAKISGEEDIKVADTTAVAAREEKSHELPVVDAAAPPPPAHPQHHYHGHQRGNHDRPHGHHHQHSNEHHHSHLKHAAPPVVEDEELPPNFRTEMVETKGGRMCRIVTDTPAGHSAGRLKLVTGFERLEEESDSSDQHKISTSAPLAVEETKMEVLPAVEVPVTYTEAAESSRLMDQINFVDTRQDMPESIRKEHHGKAGRRHTAPAPEKKSGKHSHRHGKSETAARSNIVKGKVTRPGAQPKKTPVDSEKKHPAKQKPVRSNAVATKHSAKPGPNPAQRKTAPVKKQAVEPNTSPSEINQQRQTVNPKVTSAPLNKSNKKNPAEEARPIKGSIPTKPKAAQEVLQKKHIEPQPKRKPPNDARRKSAPVAATKKKGFWPSRASAAAATSAPPRQTSPKRAPQPDLSDLELLRNPAGRD